MTRRTQLEREESAQILRELLPPGSTVKTVLRHVTQSGITRWISLVVCQDGEPVDISWRAGIVMGRNVNSRNHEGIECGGAGMDMGFDAVYSLSRCLYPDGFRCKFRSDKAMYDLPHRERCPSNDHSNYRQSRGDKVPRLHKDGGYALNHEWL